MNNYIYLSYSQVVLKTYNMLHCPLALAINEVNCLTELRHLSCVIKLLDHFIDPLRFTFVVVLEYGYPCFDLYQYMQMSPPESACKDAFDEVTKAVLMIRDAGYDYSPVVAENVVFCTSFSNGKVDVDVKLVDFEHCVRRGYRSMERGEPTQVFALGCLLLEMVRMRLIRKTARVMSFARLLKNGDPARRPCLDEAILENLNLSS